jgi:hypothetical protein
MDIGWTVYANVGGTFDVFKNGQLFRKFVPSQLLERQLGADGILTDDYDFVVRQLRETGVALVRTLIQVRKSAA